MREYDLSSYLEGLVPGGVARQAKRKPAPVPDMSKYLRGLIPPVPSPVVKPQVPPEEITAPPTERVSERVALPTTLERRLAEAPAPGPEIPQPPDDRPGAPPPYIEGQRVDTGPALARPVPDPVRLSTPTSPGPMIPVEGERIENFFAKQHGITVSGREGGAVRASAAGTVEYSQMSDAPGWGNLIIVNEGGRRRSLYAYLGDRHVAQGETVEAGQVIGTVGSTGALEEPALYFEEWQGQVPVLDSDRVFTPVEHSEKVALPPSLERKLQEKPRKKRPGFLESYAQSQIDYALAHAQAARETQARLRRVGEKYTRPGAGWLQAKLRRAPSTEEVVRRMRGIPSTPANAIALQRLAWEGLLPDRSLLPPDVVKLLKERKLDQLMEPSASRVRSGREIGLIPEQWKLNHPVISAVPCLTQKALTEFFIKPYILYPEQMPAELAIDLVAGVVIGKALRPGKLAYKKIIAKASKGKYLGFDIGDALSSFLRRTDVTLSAKTWRRFIDGSVGSGQLPKDVGRALNSLSDEQIAMIAEQIAEIGPRQTSITVAVPSRLMKRLRKPVVKKPFKPKEIVDIDLLGDFAKVWADDAGAAMPDVVKPFDAEIEELISGVDRSVLGTIGLSRRAAAATPDDLLRTFAKTVGKTKEADALARKYGSEKILDVLEQVAARTTPRDSALEVWTREVAQEVAEELQEAGQKGFVTIKRGPKAPPISDDELRQALYASRTTRGRLNRFGRWIRAKKQEVQDLITIEHEPDLVRAGQFQFRDDVRTRLMPVYSRAAEETSLQLDHNIFGTLSRKETDQLLNIMGMRSFVQSAGEGLIIPRNLTVEVVQEELEKQVRWAATNAPKVIRAAQRFEQYTGLVGEDLVRRGKISEDALKEFYLPHLVMDHMPEWWYRGPFSKRRLRDPFRPYIKERVGSAKDIAIDKEALLVHFSTVRADNLFDDAAEFLLNKYDRVNSLGTAAKQQLFGNKMTPKPGKAYTVRDVDAAGNAIDRAFRGFQYKPGNVMYRTLAVDEKLLADAIEDALLLPADQAERVAASGMDEILTFLEDVGPRGGNAIRQVLALGGYNKTYLLPEAIYNKMVRLKQPMTYIPLIYELMGVTSWWKRFTLSPFGAGIPFQITNFIGDSEALFRTAPGAMRKVPSALKIMWNINPAKERKLWGELTDAEQVLTRLIHDKHVVGSGLMREFAELKLSRPEDWFRLMADPREWMRMWERGSSQREAILRVAMTAFQYEHYLKYGKFKAPEFAKAIAGLDPESAAAFIGRNFAVDYLATPDWYRRFGRGLLTPFGTFWQRNAVNYAAYAKNAPGWFTAKFIAPRALLHFNNNMENHPVFGDLRYVEERLPDWIRRRTHLNLPAFDFDGDGEPDTAYIVAPELPADMALQFLGIDRLAEKIILMRQGDMTPVQAAKQQLMDTGVGFLRVADDLMGPMVKIMQAFKSGKHPFTGRPIVPPEFDNVPEAQLRYWGEFLAGQMLTPVGHLIGTMREGAPIREALQRKVSLFKGMGIREVNLKAEEARDRMRIVKDTEAWLRRAEYRLDEAYIKGDMEPEEFYGSEEARQIQEDALLMGVFVTPADVLELLTDPSVRIKRLQVLERRATDKEEKKAYRREWNQLLQMVSWRSLKGSPRSIRMKALERIMKAQSSRSAEDVFDYTGLPKPGAPKLKTGDLGRSTLGPGPFGR